jgi:replicative DNA helicase
LLDEAESSVFTLAHKRQLQDVHPLGDLVPPAVERIEDLIRNQKGETGLRTGYQDLDEITSGLQPSDMVILAARPSVGKTAFALNIAANAAVQYRKGVLLFSLEMSKEQLVHRLLCMVGRINSKRLRTGFLADAEFPKLTEAAGKLAPAPIFIDDAADLSILDLRSKARRIRAKHALDLIIIDYLQLMRPSDPRLPRYEQIGEISRGIKGIARELNAPVLALSQLSREAEKDDSGMPRLSHLRESGSIEQDADVVLMLSRPPAHNRDGDGGDAPIDENLINLFVAKQRNGPTGQVQLVFDREHQQFHDIVRGGAGAPPQAPPPDAPSTFDAGAILNEPFDDYEAEETGDEDDEIPF